MATNESLKNQLKKRNGNKLVNGNGEPVTLKALLASPAVKRRFEEVLDKRAPQYMTSIVNLYNSEAQLQKCDRSEEHTSELQSRENLVCRLLLEKKNKRNTIEIQ